MIQGSYVKNGELTEVTIGKSQIFEEPPLRELQVYTLKPHREKKRTKRSIVKGVLMGLSVTIPNFIYWYYISGLLSENKAVAIGFLLSQLWLVIFMYANGRK